MESSFILRLFNAWNTIIGKISALLIIIQVTQRYGNSIYFHERISDDVICAQAF